MKAKKKLLLTLFAFAALTISACGRDPAPTSQDTSDQSSAQQSEQSTEAQSSLPEQSSEQSSEPGQSSSEMSSESSSDGGESSYSYSEDSSAEEQEQGYDELKGVGVEFQIENKFYTLELHATPDEGRLATYELADVEVEKGDRVSPYVDGQAVRFWAEADADNGIYPNYDERPGSEQYALATITEGGLATFYFHENNDLDHSYSLWVLPNQQGEVPTEKEYFFVTAANEWALEGAPKFEKVEADWEQYVLAKVTLTAGQAVKATDGKGNWLGCASTWDNCGFTIDEDGNVLVNEAGDYKFDLYPNSAEGNHLIPTKLGGEPITDEIYVKVNGDVANIANIVEQLGWSDLAVFDIPLEAGDKVALYSGENAIAISAGVYEYEAEYAGTYRFGVNAGGELWFNVPENPNNYATYPISLGEWEGQGVVFAHSWKSGFAAKTFAVTEGQFKVIKDCDGFLLALCTEGAEEIIWDTNVIKQTSDLKLGKGTLEFVSGTEFKWSGDGEEPVYTTITYYYDGRQVAVNHWFNEGWADSQFFASEIDVTKLTFTAPKGATSEWTLKALDAPEEAEGSPIEAPTNPLQPGIYTYVVHAGELADWCLFVIKEGAPVVETNYYLVGIGDNWETQGAPKFTEIDSNHYQIESVALAQGEKIKATDGKDGWYGNASTWDNCGFTIDGNGNLVVIEAGNYTVDFYLESEYSNHIVLTKVQETPVYTSIKYYYDGRQVALAHWFNEGWADSQFFASEFDVTKLTFTAPEGATSEWTFKALDAPEEAEGSPIEAPTNPLQPGTYTYVVHAGELVDWCLFVIKEPEPVVETDYFLVGIGDNWGTETAPKLTKVEEGHYQLAEVALAQNEKIKVTDGKDGWYGNASTWTDCGFTIDGNGNLVVIEAGNYKIDFYVEGQNDNHIVITKLGGGEEPEEKVLGEGTDVFVKVNGGEAVKLATRIDEYNNYQYYIKDQELAANATLEVLFDDNTAPKVDIVDLDTLALLNISEAGVSIKEDGKYSFYFNVNEAKNQLVLYVAKAGEEPETPAQVVVEDGSAKDKAELQAQYEVRKYDNGWVSTGAYVDLESAINEGYTDGNAVKLHYWRNAINFRFAKAFELQDDYNNISLALYGDGIGTAKVQLAVTKQNVKIGSVTLTGVYATFNLGKQEATWNRYVINLDDDAWTINFGGNNLTPAQIKSTLGLTSLAQLVKYFDTFRFLLSGQDSKGTENNMYIDDVVFTKEGKESSVTLIEKEVVPETNYFLVGIGGDWTVEKAPKFEKVEAGHYAVAKVTLAENEKIKVTDGETGWFGNASTWENCGFTIDGEGNLVVTEAGDYKVDFYVDGQNDNHVVLTKIEPEQPAPEKVIVEDGSSDEVALKAAWDVKKYSDSWVSTAAYVALENTINKDYTEGNAVKLHYWRNTVTFRFGKAFELKGDYTNLSLAIYGDGQGTAKIRLGVTKDVTVNGKSLKGIYATYALGTIEAAWYQRDVNLDDAAWQVSVGGQNLTPAQAAAALGASSMSELVRYFDTFWLLLWGQDASGTEKNMYIDNVMFTQDNKETSKTAIEKPEEPPVVEPDYFLVGIGGDWTVEKAPKLTKVEDGHYQVAEVALAQGEKIKVTDGDKAWYGNASTWDNCGFTIDGEGNLVVTEAGNYKVDFYIDGQNDNHVVLTKIEPEQPAPAEVVVEDGSAKDKAELQAAWDVKKYNNAWVTTAAYVDLENTINKDYTDGNAVKLHYWRNNTNFRFGKAIELKGEYNNISLAIYGDGQGTAKIRLGVTKDVTVNGKNLNGVYATFALGTIEAAWYDRVVNLDDAAWQINVGGNNLTPAQAATALGAKNMAELVRYFDTFWLLLWGQDASGTEKNMYIDDVMFTQEGKETSKTAIEKPEQEIILGPGTDVFVKVGSGEAQQLATRTDEYENYQYYVLDQELEANDVLNIFFDATHAPKVDIGNDDTLGYLNIGQTVSIKEAGTYSFYFNVDTAKNQLVLYMTKAPAITSITYYYDGAQVDTNGNHWFNEGWGDSQFFASEFDVTKLTFTAPKGATSEWTLKLFTAPDEADGDPIEAPTNPLQPGIYSFIVHAGELNSYLLFVIKEPEQVVETSYHLVGTFNDWTYKDAPEFTKIDDNHYQLETINLAANTAIKVNDGGDGWYGNASTWDNCGFIINGYGDVVVSAAGNYKIDFYLNGENGNHIVLTKISGGEPEEPEEPEVPEGSIYDNDLKLEAELATIGEKHYSVDANASGGAYALGFDNCGEGMYFRYYAYEAGEREVEITYSTGAPNSKMDLRVNNQTPVTVVFTENTGWFGDSKTTATVKTTVNLELGWNDLYLYKNGANTDDPAYGGWVQVDYIVVKGTHKIFDVTKLTDLECSSYKLEAEGGNYSIIYAQAPSMDSNFSIAYLGNQDEEGNGVTYKFYVDVEGNYKVQFYCGGEGSRKVSMKVNGEAITDKGESYYTVKTGAGWNVVAADDGFNVNLKQGWNTIQLARLSDAQGGGWICIDYCLITLQGEVVKNPVTLTINAYSGSEEQPGSLLAQTSTEGLPGETYKVDLPVVPFYNAPKDSLEGTFGDENAVVNVYGYEFTSNYSVDELDYGQKIAAIPDITRDTGVYVAFDINSKDFDDSDAANGDWSELFRSENFIAYTGCLGLTSGARVYDGAHGHPGDYGEVWNALVSYGRTARIAFAFFADGTIKAYRDNILVLRWDASTVCENDNTKTVADMARAFIDDVHAKGFQISDLITSGNEKNNGRYIRNLTIGKASEIVENANVTVKNGEEVVTTYTANLFNGDKFEGAQVPYGYKVESTALVGNELTINVSEIPYVLGENRIATPEVHQEKWDAGGWYDRLYNLFGIGKGDFMVEVDLTDVAVNGYVGAEWKGILVTIVSNMEAVAGNNAWADATFCLGNNNNWGTKTFPGVQKLKGTTQTAEWANADEVVLSISRCNRLYRIVVELKQAGSSIYTGEVIATGCDFALDTIYISAEFAKFTVSSVRYA